jgi:hypothetical protein
MIEPIGYMVCSGRELALTGLPVWLTKRRGRFKKTAVKGWLRQKK